MPAARCRRGMSKGVQGCGRRTLSDLTDCFRRARRVRRGSISSAGVRGCSRARPTRSAHFGVRRDSAALGRGGAARFDNCGGQRFCAAVTLRAKVGSFPRPSDAHRLRTTESTFSLRPTMPRRRSNREASRVYSDRLESSRIDQFPLALVCSLVPKMRLWERAPGETPFRRHARVARLPPRITAQQKTSPPRQPLVRR